MTLSMTGFGTATAEEDGNRVTVEIQSVNSRYAEISVRCAKSLIDVEARIRNLAQKRIERGKAIVSVTWESTENILDRLSANVELAKAYRDALIRLKDELHLSGEIDLSLMVNLPDLFKADTVSADIDRVWPLIERTCLAALDRHTAMRRAEGEALARDMIQRIDLIEGTLQNIMTLAPLRIETYRKKLTERLETLLSSKAIDETRLTLEVALLAERCDITEECIRFQSHNAQFLDAINGDEAAGRRLNFLLQEMGREANTIGAKADDADISHLTVTIKEELEKLREQVQNIE
ncbi:MAG: YicC family protein [Candidatus Latescibacteria bacterium]|nr:YicC family protein [Candidatus Latescibacterota bacterium]